MQSFHTLQEAGQIELLQEKNEFAWSNESDKENDKDSMSYCFVVWLFGPFTPVTVQYNAQTYSHFFFFSAFILFSSWIPNLVVNTPGNAYYKYCWLRDKLVCSSLWVISDKACSNVTATFQRNCRIQIWQGHAVWLRLLSVTKALKLDCLFQGYEDRAGEWPCPSGQ